MHQFNEHHQALKGFSAFYDKEVAPNLRTSEGARLYRLSRVKRYGAIIIGLGVMLIVVSHLIKLSSDLILIIIIATAGALILMYRLLFRDMFKYTKQEILGDICKYVGWKFETKPSWPLSLMSWTQLYLLPHRYADQNIFSNGTAKREDQITGKVYGADFKSVEIKLERHQNDRKIIDFQGQIMTLTFPRKISEHTLVRRVKGSSQKPQFGDMKRVSFDDPIFEGIFEVYSTDQVECRTFLNPALLQKMLGLEKSVSGKNIRFAFFNTQLFIAIETGDRYEPGSMLKALMPPDHTQKILDEIAAIFDVVDAVSARVS